MRNFIGCPLILLVCVMVSSLCATGAAEEPWHDYGLRLYGGYLENAATIDPRDTYTRLKMGSAAEFGASFLVVINRCWDLDLAVSHARADGVQRNAPGSGNENNTLNIQMGITRLWVTGKLRYNKHEGMCVPWVGVGVNAALINSDQEEKVFVGGGYIRTERQETSSAMGFHASAGLDLYPIRKSSLAVTLETRYQMDALLNGPFDGSLDGLALLMGVKWDFWPSTSQKFQQRVR